MPYRPLNEKEKADVMSRIEAAEKDIDIRQTYLQTLNQQLLGGTWYYEPEAFKLACEESEKKAKIFLAWLYSKETA